MTGNERGDQDHDQGDAWPEIRAEQAERDRAYASTRAALHADLPFADHEAYEHERTSHE